MGDDPIRSGIYVTKDRPSGKIIEVEVRGSMHGYEPSYLTELSQGLLDGSMTVSQIRQKHPDLRICDDVLKRLTKPD